MVTTKDMAVGLYILLVMISLGNGLPLENTRQDDVYDTKLDKNSHPHSLEPLPKVDVDQTSKDNAKSLMSSMINNLLNSEGVHHRADIKVKANTMSSQAKPDTMPSKTKLERVHSESNLDHASKESNPKEIEQHSGHGSTNKLVSEQSYMKNLPQRKRDLESLNTVEWVKRVHGLNEWSDGMPWHEAGSIPWVKREQELPRNVEVIPRLEGLYKTLYAMREIKDGKDMIDGHNIFKRGHKAGIVGAHEAVGDLPWDENVGWDAYDVVPWVKRHPNTMDLIRAIKKDNELLGNDNDDSELENDEEDEVIDEEKFEAEKRDKDAMILNGDITEAERRTFLQERRRMGPEFNPTGW